MSRSSDYFLQIQKYWFYSGILFTVILAILYPSLGITDGPLKPEMTIPYLIIPLIYLITLQECVSNNHHIDISSNIIIILVMCYVISPITAYTISTVANMLGVNDWILKGFLSTSCMPPPLASGLVLSFMNNIKRQKSTRHSALPTVLISAHSEQKLQMQNNLLTAGLSNVIGAFIGCVMTPVTLYLLIGVGAIPAISSCLVGSIIAMISLAVCYFCPIRMCLSPQVNLQVAQTLILFTMYCNMCDVFIEAQAGLQAIEVLQSLMLVFSLQLLLCLISKFICKFMHNSEMLGPMVFCGTHKSVTLGFPMMQTMFGGLSHHALFSLPLLLYYATQMFIGVLLIESGLVADE